MAEATSGQVSGLRGQAQDTGDQGSAVATIAEDAWSLVLSLAWWRIRSARWLGA
jgi:hypothetical protein